MNVLQVIKYVLLATVVLALAAFLHYNLPRTDVVHVTGTDVKRRDLGAAQSVGTRDVRYISAKSRDGDIRVYRNEDTGWGWPPYFKFDSATLTAQAHSLAADPQQPWVRVRYYGWRINVFSLFPNAVSLKVVDRDYTHIPIFNIVTLLVVAVGGFLGWRLLSRFTDRFGDKK